MCRRPKLIAGVAFWAVAAGALLLGPSRAEAAPSPCAASVKAGGVLVEKRAYVYKSGLLSAMAVYSAGGTLESVSQYVYNNDDRLWGEAIDLNGDNQADRHIYYAYDKFGRLSAMAIDDGLDLTFNWIAYYSYSGNKRSARIDDNGDGTFDKTETIAYAYDDKGRLVQEWNQAANRLVVHTYDASGAPLADEVLVNGTSIQVVEYSYSCS